MAKYITFFFLAVSIAFIPVEQFASDLAEERDEARFRQLREAMVRNQISNPPYYRDPVRDNKVLEAMLNIPRHLFVRPEDISEAYEDHPLSIGYGQTISQPYIVALMTEMLEVKPEHKVLEVGTGSGYQAAVLSGIVKDVYSVEVIKALGQQASERLEKLNYDNIYLKIGDGYYGWEEHAPFDRIIVTCASTLVPPPLLKQLKPGGKMCIPVGDQYSVQYLTMVEKSESGNISMRKELPVSFVPLTRTVR
jgi:protein-L-isoaspartate(D-aspartate) O-methyltransferase